MTPPVPPSLTEASAAEVSLALKRLRDAVGEVIFGREHLIECVIMALLARGHLLLEGLPGLGKTELVRTFSKALALDSKRVQFTPDLLPGDVTGNPMLQEENNTRKFVFQRGPVFTNLLLADEINRASPKTQSALLEAMQEHRVTAGGTTYTLEQPFVVLATQNPLEMEGTYPLPEAQLDRFMMKLVIDYPNRDELTEVLVRTTDKENPEPTVIMQGERVNEMRQLCREVPIATHVRDYAVRCILATHPGGEFATPMTNQFVRYGSSPRGAQSLILAGKIRALLDGRYNVSFDDVQQTLKPVLRHRMILNFEGEAEGISTDRVIDDILEAVQPVGNVAAS